jgi:phenylpropionate dioxygenase-like ring-hydroxylating dioxygenase large terminal subunit
MTTARENELLTRVGPGTPMGALMREYWVPVARSDEVAADGNPLRVMALGEQLIAFRDSAGRIGVMDHRCPHRCASLFFGRNEEGGLRCIYHGWKYDVEGNCVDQPNLPPQQEFKGKVRAKAYPATERYGVIWTYMGARAKAPPFPDFELNNLAPGEIVVRIIQQEYNWLQGLENDLDTSHFGFLHLGSADPATIPPGDTMHYLAADRAPQFQIEDTPLGLMYGAYRPADEANTHWRLAQFITPFWCIPPAGMMADQVMMKGYIPMDDTHTLVITIQRANIAQPMGYKLASGTPIPGLGQPMPSEDQYRPNTADWFGRWRLKNCAENDFLIDREAQRHGGVFSGIVGLAIQDTAIAGTMGPIMDRTFENLAPSDAMIARMRRKLLQLIAALEKDKDANLPGVDDPSVYRGHRAGNFIAPKGQPFREAYEERMRQHANAAPRWAAE